jgi:hypothetical protein
VTLRAFDHLEFIELLSEAFQKLRIASECFEAAMPSGSRATGALIAPRA